METVLTAALIIFLILFASLTLYQGYINSQNEMVLAWQAMETRMDEQARTSLAPVSTRITNAGTLIELVVKNQGTLKLANFEQWDTIIEYYDESNGYHIEWLSYTEGIPLNGEWTVASIYQNAVLETYERGIFNPGEEMIIQIAVSPAVGAGKSLFITVASDNGSITTHIFTRNIPPALMTNTGVNLAAGKTVTLSPALLEVTDADNTPDELVYTVTAAPTQGNLNITFTQDDINNGLVEYTHTGTGSDAFSFTVSDGQDVIGEYVFEVTVNEAPVLEVNQSLVLSEGNTIGQTLLETTDPDNTPDKLIYTVTVAPEHGSLTLGTTFTQEDINNGLLQYTGTGSDSFQFTVSDGLTTIGVYIFTIVP